jgi:hypothetical protein
LILTRSSSSEASSVTAVRKRRGSCISQW